MKTIWALLSIMTFPATAAACSIQVRMTNTTAAAPLVLYQAKSTATAMFAAIGVKLEWTASAPKATCGKPIEIRLEARGPGAEQPDSLAYAMPYLKGGVSIHVFVERVAAVAPANRTGLVLGHVLAHEITHVLQGISRHSDSGVMKPHWDARDLRAMEFHPLPFASVDVLLLQAGLQAGPTGTSATTDTVAAAQ